MKSFNVVKQGPLADHLFASFMPLSEM